MVPPPRGGVRWMKKHPVPVNPAGPHRARFRGRLPPCPRQGFAGAILCHCIDCTFFDRFLRSQRGLPKHRLEGRSLNPEVAPGHDPEAPAWHRLMPWRVRRDAWDVWGEAVDLLPDGCAGCFGGLDLRKCA